MKELFTSTLFWTFVILNIANVIIQTVKSICTINCGKVVAALANAIAYGLYTVVVVYMVCDLPLWLKVVVIGTCNLIGVYIVKDIEERSRKDRLWEIKATIRPNSFDKVTALCNDLNTARISHNHFRVNGDYEVFQIYSPNQETSRKVREILNKHNAKYFVSEGKVL